MTKKKKQQGGPGRGNKDHLLNDPHRPDCDRCGEPMVSKGKREWVCRPCGRHVSKKKVIEDKENISRNEYIASMGFDVTQAIAHANKCAKGRRLIVTSGQNNTDVHDKGLQALKQACQFYNCELAVMPSHYLNKDKYTKGDKKGFDRKLLPHLVAGDIKFGNVILKSDVRIQATTLFPLAGMQAHGGEDWIIFGHPQIAREPVPTPGNMMPKNLFTTGSVTVPNYQVSNIGEKAKFHHIQGSLILEKYKDIVFVRQLNWDDNGHFYDLDVRFTPSGWSEGHRALSLTPGDEHVKWNTCEKVTYSGKHSMVKVLRPEFIVRHDILDGYAGSHHHEKDPMVQYKKFVNGDDDYEAEMKECVDFINRTTPKESKTLIVPSNHHDHLLKFLNRADANKDHRNAHFILEMQKLMREAVDAGEHYDPFYLWMKDRLTCKFEFLNRNEAYFIGDVDHSQHFDVGANGTRATPRGLARSVFKMSGGHGHGGMIVQGVYRAGVSTGTLEYERGLSTHSNCHILQYGNWKRTLVDIMYDRYCAPRTNLGGK